MGNFETNGGGFAIVTKSTLELFQKFDTDGKYETKHRITERELPLVTPTKTIQMTKVLVLQFGEKDVTFTNNILQFPKPVLPHTILSVRLIKGFTTGVPFDKLESDQNIFANYVTDHIGET